MRTNNELTHGGEYRVHPIANPVTLVALMLMMCWAFLIVLALALSKLI